MGRDQIMFPGMRASGKRCGVMLAEPHGYEAVRREVGLEKFSGRVVAAKDGFGGQITAADGAFHRGGPAGVGPIPCQEQTRHRGLLLPTPAVDPRLWRKCCSGLLDEGG